MKGGVSSCFISLHSIFAVRKAVANNRFYDRLDVEQTLFSEG